MNLIKPEPSLGKAQNSERTKGVDVQVWPAGSYNSWGQRGIHVVVGRLGIQAVLGLST